mgnify:CR=1 FL=1
MHEHATLVTLNEFRNEGQTHCEQWKQIYGMMMKPFLGKKIFPADVQALLERSLHDLPASSCSDERLTRALNKYDDKQPGYAMVEELNEGDLFSMGHNKIFRKGTQLRKRIQCLELSTGKLFLFSPFYEVKTLQQLMFLFLLISNRLKHKLRNHEKIITQHDCIPIRFYCSESTDGERKLACRW